MMYICTLSSSAKTWENLFKLLTCIYTATVSVCKCTVSIVRTSSSATGVKFTLPGRRCVYYKNGNNHFHVADIHKEVCVFVECIFTVCISSYE